MIGAARVCSGPVWCTDPCSVNCGARPGNLGLVGGEEGGVRREEGRDPEDFANLSREDQLRILEHKSWVKNIDFNKVYCR